MNLIKLYKKNIKENHWLSIVEFTSLSLMIIALPSLEAPKNIFLIFFVVFAIINQIKNLRYKIFDDWDFVFLLFISCALFTAIFAGYAPGNEWSGFRMLLTYSLVGWMISRSNYSEKSVLFLYLLILISTIPPLIWGLIEYLIINSKSSLQLHSVGNVNHSAIYMAIIFGSSLTIALKKIKIIDSILSRFFLVLLALLIFIGIEISQSRAAFGIAIFLAFVITIITNIDIKIKIKIFATYFLMIISMVFLNVDVIKKQKQFERSGDILAGRSVVWNIPLEASKYYPFFGIGMDNWKSIKLESLEKSISAQGKDFNEDVLIAGLKAGHSHNLYLQALLERGILGLVSILGLMTYWMQYLIRTYRENRKSDISLISWGGSFSAWIVTFTIGIFNSTLHHEHGILAFLFLSLHICANKNYLIKDKIRAPIK